MMMFPRLVELGLTLTLTAALLKKSGTSDKAKSENAYKALLGKQKKELTRYELYIRQHVC